MDINSVCGVKNIKIVFDEANHNSILTKSRTFAEQMSKKEQSIDYYKSERDAIKPKKDTIIGKIGECYTYYYLTRSCNFPTIMLDKIFDVRCGSDKGWEIDLCFNDRNSLFPNVHVKTCTDFTVGVCDDFSWTFQWKNLHMKGGKDDIFKESSSNDLVSFVYTPNINSHYAFIKAILPVSILNDYFKQPVINRYKKTKKCIYYRDLIENEEHITHCS